MYNQQRSIDRQAKERRDKWISTHQVHEWGKRDLKGKAQEELADAWNYILADMLDCDLRAIQSHTRALELIHKAWEELEYPYQVPTIVVG